MKKLNDYISESIKQTSEIRGSVGRVWSAHQDELNKIKTVKGLIDFVTNTQDEMNDEAKKYIENEVIPTLKKNHDFIKSYHYLYNIILAGYEDTRLGKK